jgi:hypothetical protein
MLTQEQQILSINSLNRNAIVENSIQPTFDLRPHG